MAPSDCKNQGTESHGYQALIEIESCWDDCRPCCRLPEVGDIETDGWASVRTIARHLCIHRQAASIKLNLMLNAGRVERKVVACKCGNGRGRVAFFRAIPKTASA